MTTGVACDQGWEPPFFLGIEGGATRSTGVLLDGRDRCVQEFHGPAANIRLVSESQLGELLRGFDARLPRVRLGAVGVGFAGVRTGADRERVREAVARVWPGVACYATNDLETALETALPDGLAAARVLVLSGTGSCCFGLNRAGVQATVGGRGHVVGDRGSAWDISQQALRAVMAEWDHTGKWPPLGGAILRTLCINDIEGLIAWSLHAGKTEVAGLASAVFERAARGDKLARKLLQAAARALSEDADACAARLAAPGERVQFVMNGGVLLKNPGFLRMVRSQLRKQWPACIVTAVKRASCWGAALLAKTRCAIPTPPPAEKNNQPTRPRAPGRESAPASFAPADECLHNSPTEMRNPRSKHLDRMPLQKAIELMLKEERGVTKALLVHEKEILWAVNGILRAFRSGGRLFYIGAGTSGRLGILDASECPPTFRSPGDQVQGIIAGGPSAIWSAVEGAEDDTYAGAEAVRNRGVCASDFVVGIAASGRTPFVWSALAEAGRRGARTLLVCFNPGLKKARLVPSGFRPDKILAPNLGPEVLTGSTRLKCGTATKILLNIFSTLSLARSGKVVENLMVDLRPSNSKLRERAVRILTQIQGCLPAEAREALQKHNWSIPRCIKALRAPQKRVEQN